MASRIAFFPVNTKATIEKYRQNTSCLKEQADSSSYVPNICNWKEIINRILLIAPKIKLIATTSAEENYSKEIDI